MNTRQSITAVAVWAVVSAAAMNGSAAGAPAAPARTFAQVVTASFAGWDANHDGKLSADEVDQAVASPKNKDDVAAAMGAIKMVVRGGKYSLPALTLAYLASSPAKEGAADARDTEFADDPAKPGAKNAAPAFEPRYTASLKRIRNTSRVLFPEKLPSLTTAQQGPLGDCYFVSTIGVFVYRNPEAVRNMITQNANGSYTVRFAGAGTVELAPLTDGDIAVSSTSGTNGLWLPVLENAYGKIREKLMPKGKQSEVNTDAIADGGAPGVVMQALVGQKPQMINFRDAKGQPVPEATLAGEVTAALTAAVRDKRLSTSGTPKGNMPPGMDELHVYAVLGYDSSKKMVTLWNPHNNNFTPKGPAGLKDGYSTVNGRFDMPLNEMTRVYHYVTTDTDTPKK